MHMVKDPVCGIEVDEKTAEYKSIYANNVYYFSSSTCKAEFDKNPEKYLPKFSDTHHASHYGGYCGPSGCGAPARGVAWYFYIGLLFLILLLLLLLR